MAYPDYSEVFEIYTDASSKQLGAVITQKNRPNAFFSRKLSVAQRKYGFTEIELLAIVETLEEFKGMLVDIPFIADWKKIGEHRQPTDRNTDRENKSRVDYDNKVVTKYTYGTMVFLRKAKSRYL